MDVLILHKTHTRTHKNGSRQTFDLKQNNIIGQGKKRNRT